ncbi:hypothetical protein M758_6G205100 [Ceratodon purpureus]|nr:hypothetical protein M758_6G205100 [Ceratodon purpureus]
MADPVGEDVEMTDAAEGSGPSVFALLQPKRESVAPAASKGKFAPKVKARPGARARAQPSGPVQTETPVSDEPGIPLALGDVPGASASIDTKAVIAGASSPLLAVKPEPDVAKPEPVNDNPLLKVKPEPVDDPGSKMQVDAEPIEEPAKEEVKEEPSFKEKEEEVPAVHEEPMLKEPIESTPGVDRIVREIDVFLTPHVDSETNLYVLQYPLRPYWRPYNLEERCQEVRIKPQMSKFEVDLVIDTDSENYDQDREEHLQISTQTLASSKVAMNTSYAIGVLRGNQLHLNPVQAVVQFRPSMKYIEAHDAAKKKSNKEAGINDGDEEEMYDAEPTENKSELTLLQVNVRRRETERQEANRLQSHAYLKQLEEAEAWIPLEPHGTDSPVTEGIRQKMVAKTQDRINFNMSPDAYLGSLVPGRASTSTAEFLKEEGNVGISRSHLETLALPFRIPYIFEKGLKQVLQFERVMRMAPAGCSEEELLAELVNSANLVQGCWVCASHVRPQYRPIRAQRDYILLLFSRNRVVKYEQLRGLPLNKETLRDLMVPLAVQRAGVGWEFKEDTDKSFMKKHQPVVKQQATQWAESEAGITGALIDMNPYFPGEYGTEPTPEEKKKPVSKSGKPGSGSSASRPPSGKPLGSKSGTEAGDGGGKSNVENGESSEQGTMSTETRAALPGALKEIFARHHVCSMQIIVQSLRDMAIERTVANSNPKAAAAAVAAAKAANAPAAELTAAVNRVATSLGGVYMLTSLGNPTLDPFRDVVIALLKKMGPSTGLRKTEIMGAFKIATGRDAPTTIYQKVMKELCYTRGGAWVLKPGDGRP